MADDFGRSFQYGLSDLPMEPPDDFNALNPAGGLASMGGQGLPPPEVIPAGFRFPLPSRVPAGAYPPPGWPIPGIPAPRIPDWWRGLGAAAQILPRIISEGGGGGDDRGGDKAEKNSPDCKEDWEKARAACVDELSKPNPSRNLAGETLTMTDCVKGRVKEACGGGRYERQPEKRPRTVDLTRPPKKKKKNETLEEAVARLQRGIERARRERGDR